MCFKTTRRVLMAGREQELHRPLSGRSEGKRDEGKYGLRCRYTSGETEGATSGQAKKKKEKSLTRRGGRR